MKRNMKLTKTRTDLLLLVGFIIYSASMTNCMRCTYDWEDPPVCPPGEFRCDDMQCHPCCYDSHCWEYHDPAGCSEDRLICNNDYECECIGWDSGEDCSRDPEACFEHLVCDVFTNTCVTECTSDTECARRTEIPFSDDLKCRNGVCDFVHCTRDIDCVGGKVCYAGDCVTIHYDFMNLECVVLPPAAVTREGTTAELAATAHFPSGAMAPGISFTWSSSDENIATVAGGLVTGGADTGVATITAEIIGSESKTCTASVTNYGAPAGTRVIVVDDQDFFPVAEAAVTVGSEGPVMTDAAGVAAFSTEISQANPQDITVIRKEYNYITLRGVERSDVIVHLSKVHHLDFSQDPPRRVSAGVKCELKFNLIRCEPPLKTCDVTWGIAGISVPANLLYLGPDMLLGRDVKTEIELGGSKETIPLPEGMVLCLNQTCFKGHCTPTGVPGNRVVWAIGGKLDLADLIDKLGPIISGGEDVDVGSLVAGLIQLFQLFYTAMVPNVVLTPIPMVPDIDDIDDDPDTPEAPDYDNFQPIELTLKVGMDESMTFVAPPLPVGTYDSVFMIGGIIVRGAGFVPLGMSAGTDSTSQDDIPDGLIDEAIILHVADVIGRIPEEQVQRVVIAVAQKLAMEEGEPEYFSMQILLVDKFYGAFTLDTFIPPAAASYDPATRNLSVTHVPDNADFLQTVFLDDLEAGWQILGEWAPGDYTLPPPPPEGDRAATAGIYAVDLDPVGYQDVLEFNDTNLGNIIEAVKAFSYKEIPLP